MNKTKHSKRNFWKPEEEHNIKQWADRAQCYQWMHSRCREIYQTKNAWFTIPVIIISTTINLQSIDRQFQQNSNRAA